MVLFNNTDDLDPEFTPDPDMLGNSAASLEPNVTMVTKVTESEEHKKNPEANEPSLSKLVESEVVILQDKESKVVQLKDIHDSLVGKDGINRLDAENISTASENFLSKRLSLNEFTTSNSKINFNKTLDYLKVNIAKEEREIKALKKRIATESVMQYASSLGMTSSPEEVQIAPNAKNSLKGAYFFKEGDMIDIAKLEETDLIAMLGEQDASIVKDSILELYRDHFKGTLMSYINARVVGNLEVPAAVANAVITDVGFLKANVIFEYFVKHYREDLDLLEQEYDRYKDYHSNYLEEVNLDEDEEDVTGFILKVKDLLYNFKTMEAIEELQTKLPAMASIFNKFIEIMKY